MNRVSDRDTRLTRKLWTEWFRRSRFNLSTSDHPAKGGQTEPDGTTPKRMLLCLLLSSPRTQQVRISPLREPRPTRAKPGVRYSSVARRENRFRSWVSQPAATSSRYATPKQRAAPLYLLNRPSIGKGTSHRRRREATASRMQASLSFTFFRVYRY